MIDMELRFHGITNGMAKEFCRDYIGTCKTKEINPYKFRTVKQIAKIMEIPVNKAIDFIVVAEKANYMVKDAYDIPDTSDFPRMFKVWEDML